MRSWHGPPHTARLLAVGRLVLILALFGLGAVSLAPAATAADSPGSVTESPSTTNDPHLWAITAGPDGNVWFTEAGANRVGKITPTGVWSDYPLPTGTSPNSIATGADGNLWVTEGSGGIARVTPAGVVTEFPLSSAFSQPQAIVGGADGNLWFTEARADRLGRITPAGAITEFPLQASAAPAGIAAGADGNLWFTESGLNRIGRMTPSGTLTEFPLPTANAGPAAMTAGPDGNLWFTEVGANRVGRMTPSGTATDFAVPYGFNDGSAIAAGADGNVWFTEVLSVTRITPTGAITDFPLSLPSDWPTGIAAGPDGDEWFLELGTRRIARLVPSSGDLTEFPGPGGLVLSAIASGSLWYTDSGANAVGSGGRELPLPTPNAAPHGITSGPDSGIWFTERAGNKIGHVPQYHATISEFAVPTPNSQPDGITTGMDGNLWFTENAAGRIGRLTTDGSITEFPLPSSTSQTDGIALGPDGNLWFTESSLNRIGRITPTGAITDGFALPTPNSQPASIVTGSDGNLWFVETAGNRIGRIAPATGAIAEFSIPTAQSQPTSIASGPDGNLWFTETAVAKIGRISPSGALTEFSLPSPGSRPVGIASGNTSLLWFTDVATQAIGSIASGPTSSVFMTTQVYNGLNGESDGWIGGTTSLSANWGPVQGAASYEVALGVSPLDTSLAPYTNVGTALSATLPLASGTHLVEGGTYFVSLRARDASGLATVSVTSTGARVDTTPPTATLTQPAADTSTNIRSLVGTASDTLSGVASVQFQRSADGSTWTNVGRAVGGTSPYQLQPSATDLPEGTWQVRLVATDNAGNTTASAPVRFTLDTTPPAPPSITSPTRPETVTTSSITVTGTAEPNALVRVRSARYAIVASEQLAGGATAFGIPVPLTLNADNSFFVDAVDAAGNPSAATWLPDITQRPDPCPPRPSVQLSVQADGQGGLDVVVTSGAANVALQSIQFAAASNGLVSIGPLLNPTPPFTFSLPSGATQVSFSLHRAAAGLATTLPLTVVDACGSWPTLVGGGPSAF